MYSWPHVNSQQCSVSQLSPPWPWPPRPTKAVATIEKLSEEIAELEEDISIWEGDIKAATKVREIENGDYDKTHADYSESVDALDRAIKVLKDKSVNTAQASLLQVKSLNMIPDTAKNAIQQFLQQDPEFLD